MQNQYKSTHHLLIINEALFCDHAFVWLIWLFILWWVECRIIDHVYCYENAGLPSLLCWNSEDKLMEYQLKMIKVCYPWSGMLYVAMIVFKQISCLQKLNGDFSCTIWMSKSCHRTSFENHHLISQYIIPIDRHFHWRVLSAVLFQIYYVLWL